MRRAISSPVETYKTIAKERILESSLDQLLSPSGDRHSGDKDRYSADDLKNSRAGDSQRRRMKNSFLTSVCQDAIIKS